MTMNMHDKIGPMLDDLKKEKRKAFQRRLLQLPSAKIGVGDFVPPITFDAALQELESCVSEMASDAVSRVCPVSGTLDAFVQIQRATDSFFSDLSQVLEHWHQLRIGRPVSRAVDDMRTAVIRLRVERHLDTYRPQFTAHATGSTRAKSKAGRDDKYDWFEAANAVWGKIYRTGTPDPARDPLARIEEALSKHFALKGEYPSEAAIRKKAREIKDEAQKED